MRLLLTLSLLLTLLADSSALGIDYNRDVRPILSQNCFVCHGPDEGQRKGKLRLDTEKGLRKVIVAGDPTQSELITRITSKDSDEIMPSIKSGKELTSKEIETLRKWVGSGAKYSEPWAYRVPVKSPVPEQKGRGWGKNWIDSFLLKRWDSEGINPIGDADKVIMIRRLFFDVTGLPPQIEVVDQFMAAKDADSAYEEIVDKLLASDHFGERMASYWLDLVRFADTVGYHGDQDHNITPYRDYVLDAFNLNLPFDQFTREQLAGDLLENPTIDQKVASGYNRLLQTSHEGGVQQREYLAIYAADRMRNLSSVWMGATLGCAQCHDHKYDPFTSRDFYSMSAFFADIDESQHFKVGSNSLPTKRPPEIRVLSRRDREQVKLLELKVPRTKEIEERIKQLKTRETLTMVTQSIEPRLTRILPRGDWLDESGEVVEPAVPVFLGKLETSGRRATRFDLANWLTDPEKGIGGLTARVFVNRLWYLFFGEGISTSLDDFGGQGSPPVYPELLDNLAVHFYEGGWDVKMMVKLLVTSRAYRQSSLTPKDFQKRDPLNHLFARQSRFRLPAEMVRDTALAVSGLLATDYGGPSVKPYQPEGYYRHLNFPQRKYEQHNDARRYRRGVYVHWQRQFLHPMLKAMDAPSREECTAKRPRSNTPIAALVLLNDPSFYEAARAFAGNVLKNSKQQAPERIEYAFRAALSRKPDPEEKRILNQLLKESKIGSADKDDTELDAWTAVTRAIFNCSEFNTRN